MGTKEAGNGFYVLGHGLRALKVEQRVRPHADVVSIEEHTLDLDALMETRTIVTPAATKHRTVTLTQ